MKLKYLFENVEIEEQNFAVPLEDCGKDFNGVVKLNKSAADIFQLLKEETDEESIVEQMSKHYDVSKDILAADVHNIIEEFKAKGLLA